MTDDQHRERYGKTLDVHRMPPAQPYTLVGSVTLCRSCHGPEPKVRGGRKSEPSASIRVFRSFAHRFKRIALHAGRDPGDYFAEVFEPVLAADEEAMFEDMAKEFKASKEK